MRAHYQITELGKQLVILTAADQVRHLTPELRANWHQKKAAGLESENKLT